MTLGSPWRPASSREGGRERVDPALPAVRVEEGLQAKHTAPPGAKEGGTRGSLGPRGEHNPPF